MANWTTVMEIRVFEDGHTVCILQQYYSYSHHNDGGCCGGGGGDNTLALVPPNGAIALMPH